MNDIDQTRRSSRQSQGGFTLIELLLSVTILMVVSGLMLRGTLDMGRLNTQQTNRSEMHAGIRNATALLQQEVGQAGRVAFPNAKTLATTVAAGNQWVQVNNPAGNPDASGIFVGEQLVITRGNTEEIVTVLDVNASQIQATFASSHTAGAQVRPAGGFSAGIIPTTMTNGSTGMVLKIVGDINNDGNLVYVEYTCDWQLERMSRNMMAYTAVSKPPLTVEHVLLDNLERNPPDSDGTVPPCFRYEERTFGGRTYVINVAILTTVRTDERDPVTGQFQRVTKALLNVAPRNVFHVWQIASLGYDNRIQPLPQSVVNLLP